MVSRMDKGIEGCRIDTEKIGPEREGVSSKGELVSLGQIDLIDITLAYVVTDLPYGFKIGLMAEVAR
jgi:hypothetical protein